MAVTKASASGLAGSKFKDASAGTSKIVDVPDTPTNVVATNVGTSRAFNNGSATISVDALTGGIPTTYTATSTPGSLTGTSATSPVTVTGLDSSTSYTFTVVAGNTTGTSGSSAASNSITSTTVPGIPTVGTATIVSGTSITLAFTAPATGGSAITGYTVVSNPSVALTTSAGTTSPVTATGTFDAAQGYTFTIAAINANGTGSASSASNSIQPYNPVYSLVNTYTSSTNYTIPAGIDAIAAFVVGGGGGGGAGGGGCMNSTGTGFYIEILCE
jgi:hypothetical protein